MLDCVSYTGKLAIWQAGDAGRVGYPSVVIRPFTEIETVPAAILRGEHYAIFLRVKNDPWTFQQHWIGD